MDVITHSDVDGLVSLLLFEFSDNEITKKIYTGYNRLEDTVLGCITSPNKSKDIAILDISFNKDLYDLLKKEFDNVLWIDHHLETVNNNNNTNIIGHLTNSAAHIIYQMYKHNIPEELADNVKHLTKITNKVDVHNLDCFYSQLLNFLYFKKFNFASLYDAIIENNYNLRTLYFDSFSEELDLYNQWKQHLFDNCSKQRTEHVTFLNGNNIMDIVNDIPSFDNYQTDIYAILYEKGKRISLRTKEYDMTNLITYLNENISEGFCGGHKYAVGCTNVDFEEVKHLLINYKF